MRRPLILGAVATALVLATPAVGWAAWTAASPGVATAKAAAIAAPALDPLTFVCTKKDRAVLHVAWAAVPRANDYRIEYDDNAAFASAANDSTTGTSDDLDVRGVTSATTIYVRTRANRLNWTGAWATTSMIVGPCK